MSHQQEKKQNQLQQPTIIGPSCRIRGDMTLDGSAVVLGQVDGIVQVSGELEIGKEGGVQGSVLAGSVNLQGKVSGDVRTEGSIDLTGVIEGDVICRETMQIGSQATLLGNMFAKAITICEGATYRGHVVIGPDAVAEAEQSQNDNAIGNSEFQNPTTVGRITPTAMNDYNDEQPLTTTVVRRRPSILGRTTAVTS